MAQNEVGRAVGMGCKIEVGQFWPLGGLCSTIFGLTFVDLSFYFEPLYLLIYTYIHIDQLTSLL